MLVARLLVAACQALWVRIQTSHGRHPLAHPKKYQKEIFQPRRQDFVIIIAIYEPNHAKRTSPLCQSERPGQFSEAWNFGPFLATTFFAPLKD